MVGPVIAATVPRRRGRPRPTPWFYVAAAVLEGAGPADATGVFRLLVGRPARPVTREGRRIELSPKEFALLELFMRHSEEVMTRSQILDHVWDFAYAGTSNVVDVCVRYLRDKIARPSMPPPT